MKEKYDLVVVGGGLAGVCGALAARRLGLSVCIIQDRPVFGGNASSEIRVPIGGAGSFNAWARETGIIAELFLDERRRNFQFHNSSLANSILDLVLYDALREAGVDMFLNTSCRKGIMKSKELIEGVYCVQLGSEKEFIIKGDYFLDASGDGALAFSVGAEFSMGREGKEEFGEELAPPEPDMGIMGNSLMFLVRDCGKPVPFEPPSWAIKYPKDDVTLKLRPHNSMPGYWWIEIGYPYDTIYDNEEIKHNLLAHLLGVWDHLKNQENHGFENFSLEWVGMVPGKRESRRFIGDYILKEQDLKTRKQFPDAVAYGGWFIDLHTPGGILAKEDYPEPCTSGNVEEWEKRFVYVYQIPFRCLYSKNIKNLFLAGRNISVTHIALGSTRLMGTCALLGQASGTAAYLCKKYKSYPRDIFSNHIRELQQQLLKDGCFIPGVKNEDPADLARKASVSASSSFPLEFSQCEGEVQLNQPIGQKLPLEGKVEKIILKLKALRDTTLVFHLRASADLWDFTVSDDIIQQELAIKSGEEELEIVINREFERGIYWFFLEPDEAIFLRETSESLPGLCEIYRMGRLWRFKLGRNIFFKTVPLLYPFSPDNIVSGVSRPESWTNVWISNPREKFPQWILLDLGEKEEFNQIQLTFDAEIDKEYHQLPPLYVPPSIPCDFIIWVEEDKGWRKVHEVKNNKKHFLRLSLPMTKARKLKVEFLSLNGGDTVRLYEMRIYKNGFSNI
ncbi:FAD-dependent oxidoreductase [bacterium]|nr:FAD-dependent oxidoreductase [bacterium]